VCIFAEQILPQWAKKEKGWGEVFLLLFEYSKSKNPHTHTEEKEAKKEEKKTQKKEKSLNTTLKKHDTTTN
jgi:hypothetical protein